MIHRNSTHKLNTCERNVVQCICVCAHLRWLTVLLQKHWRIIIKQISGFIKYYIFSWIQIDLVVYFDS